MIYEARGNCVKQEGNIKYQGGKSDTNKNYSFHLEE